MSTADRLVIKIIGTLVALGFLAGGLLDWYAKRAFDWHAGGATLIAVLVGCSLIDSKYTQGSLKPIRELGALIKRLITRTPPPADQP